MQRQNSMWFCTVTPTIRTKQYVDRWCSRSHLAPHLNIPIRDVACRRILHSTHISVINTAILIPPCGTTMNYIVVLSLNGSEDCLVFSWSVARQSGHFCETEVKMITAIREYFSFMTCSIIWEEHLASWSLPHIRIGKTHLRPSVNCFFWCSRSQVCFLKEHHGPKRKQPSRVLLDRSIKVQVRRRAPTACWRWTR